VKHRRRNRKPLDSRLPEPTIREATNAFSAPQASVFDVPRRVPHSVRNISVEDSRVLVTHVPGGFEKFFAEVSDLRDVQKIIEIAKHHDVEFLPQRAN
jgi:hypothetical protein